MERVKIVLLGVIATTLVADAASRWMPTAHAQAAAPVTCKSFLADAVVAKPEKALTIADASAAPVQQWLAEHPGQPAYHTTYPVVWAGMTTGYVEVVCVR